MRIGVVSDSHGSRERLLRAIQEMGKIDWLFHLGDGARDLTAVAAAYDGPITAVRGNQDFAHDLPPLAELTLEGQRILLTHGHTHHVKGGLAPLIGYARERGARIVCYGHTHRADCSVLSGILLVNPGSIAGARPGYAVLRIQGGKVTPSLHALGEAADRYDA
ncbi:MAG: metallophosphoesterase [Clostridiales bacterium]|nr:metallophosphoesterase [Clostridiales bacterium]